MLIVPSVVPEKYRSLGKGKMPCAGWNKAAVAAGVTAPPPPGLRLPAVGSVGLTSGEFPVELEQPAAVSAATSTTAAADSLFMSSLLGILFRRFNPVAFPRRAERCAELVVLGR